MSWTDLWHGDENECVVISQGCYLVFFLQRCSCWVKSVLKKQIHKQLELWFDVVTKPSKSWGSYKWLKVCALMDQLFQSCSAFKYCLSDSLFRPVWQDIGCMCLQCCVLSKFVILLVIYVCTMTYDSYLLSLDLIQSHYVNLAYYFCLGRHLHSEKLFMLLPYS